MSEKKSLQTIVSVELYTLLSDLASLDNKSVSQLLRDILDSCEPELRKARDMMIAAQDLQAEARKRILPELERHAQHMQESHSYSMENIDQTIRKEAKTKDAKASDPPQHKLPL